MLYSRNGTEKVVPITTFDFETKQFDFREDINVKNTYRKFLDYKLTRDRVELTYEPGQQKSYFSLRPYTPFRIDTRYGKPTNTWLKDLGGCDDIGRDSLSAEYTVSSFIGQVAERELDYLISEYKNYRKPFSLGVSLVAPHPPTLATSQYLDNYYKSRANIRLPPSIQDKMPNSPYIDSGKRYQMDDTVAYGYDKIGECNGKVFTTLFIHSTGSNFPHGLPFRSNEANVRRVLCIGRRRYDMNCSCCDRIECVFTVHSRVSNLCDPHSRSLDWSGSR